MHSKNSLKPTAIGRTSMSKIDYKRGEARGSSKRQSVGARVRRESKLEDQVFNRHEAAGPAFAAAGARLAPIEKKRLIDLERRAQFQRPGGSAR
jgi:hypothetical protein